MDLGKPTRNKTKVHALNARHKQNRKTNARKLYEQRVAGGRAEYLVTFDEALFFVQDCNGTRRICYTKSRDECNNYVFQKKEKFADKLMVVGAMSGRGVLPLIPVRTNAKVSSNYYVDNVLKRILEEEIPKLCPGETAKVYVHHDAASSHTARFTQQYAADLQARTGITLIANTDIPVKPPDGSPIDFFGFGYLKQQIYKRRASRIPGLWKNPPRGVEQSYA